MTTGDRPFARRAGDLEAPLTQVVDDRDDYLGQSARDIGRRISDMQVELFISSDVAGALQQEFRHHAPAFVAVHDIGTAASLRLLESVASAAAAKLQSLTVRRQGQGVALAVLRFVEVPLADGSPIRVYATDVDADSATRIQVGQVLLAHSRLGVLLVGELPPHALSSQLAPLAEAIQRGPWPNRDLLLVPLGSGTALAAQASQLAGRSAVTVRVSPHANKTRLVWGFIGGAWNRLQAGPGGERELPATLAGARAAGDPPPTTRSMVLPAAATPEPAAAMAIAMPRPPRPPGTTAWQAYADRCALIKGTLGCCIFDSRSQQPLAQSGGTPAAERLARQGAALLAAMNEAARALGIEGDDASPDASISIGNHHLLLRPVSGHPGVAVHLLLAAGTGGHLTLARMQLERIAGPGP